MKFKQFDTTHIPTGTIERMVKDGYTEYRTNGDKEGPWITIPGGVEERIMTIHILSKPGRKKRIILLTRKRRDEPNAGSYWAFAQEATCLELTLQTYLRSREVKIDEAYSLAKKTEVPT